MTGFTHLAVILQFIVNGEIVISLIFYNQQSSYVNISDNNNTTPTASSQAQGLGLLITVKAARKGLSSEKDFIPLYHYYKDHRVSEDNSLMAWKQVTGEYGGLNNVNHNSATDGDLDIAYALVLASQLWPQSVNNYQKDANDIIEDLLQNSYNKQTGLLTVGNWATVDREFQYLVRPADLKPKYFDVFYEFTQDDTWQNIKNNSLDVIEKLSQQHASGLMPDYCWLIDGDLYPSNSNKVSHQTFADGNFDYNSSSILLNIGHYNDSRATESVKKMLDFFTNQNPVVASYTLTGKPLVDYSSASISAPILYAANGIRKYNGLSKQESWIAYNGLQGNSFYSDSIETLTYLLIY